MKVIVKGFRCHRDSEYSFNDNSITLLSGASGAGKSTILQAIFWCLYGGLRNIYTNGTKSGKISVTLVFPHCTIYRQGRPNLLEIALTPVNTSLSQTSSSQINEHSVKKYQDATAQEIIDKMFGIKDLWRACCYIEQNSRCTLLTGSNNDRMDLLNKLSFSTDNPEECITKIDGEIKHLDRNFTVAQALFSQECENFSQELSRRGVEPSTIPLIPQLDEMKQQYSELDVQLKQLERTRLQQMELIGTHKILSSNLEQLTQQLTKQLADSGIKESDLDAINSDNMRREVTSFEQTLADLNVKQMEYVRNCAQRDQITKELSDKQEQLSNHSSRLTDDNGNSIEDMSNEIVDIDRSAKNCDEILEQRRLQQIQLRQLSNLEEQFSSRHDSISNYLHCTYTDQDVWEIKKQEQTYLVNSKLAAEIGINYTQEDIDQAKQEQEEGIEKETELISRLKSYHQVKTLYGELTGIPTEDHEVTITDDQIYKAREYYTQLNQSVGLLSCPHCGKSVRYVGGSLHPEEIKPVNPDDIKEALDILTKLQQRRIHQTKANEIKNQIVSLAPSCGDTQELDSLPVDRTPLDQRKKLLTQLCQIVVVEKPTVSSELVSNVIQYKKIKQELNGFDEMYTGVDTTIQEQLDQLKLRRQHLQSEISSIQMNTAIRKQLETTIASLNERLGQIIIGEDNTNLINQMTSALMSKKSVLDSYENIQRIHLNINQTRKQLSDIILIPDIDQQYSDLQQSIATKRQLIDDVEYASNMIGKQQKLELKRGEVVTDGTYLTNMRKLRQTAIDVECAQLQSTVDSINIAMQNILDVIFEEPIIVVIRLYKQLKTNKSIKANVNLYISYRGAEYDNINALSGGEGDRVSFALTVALNQVSTSPLLMLDESMSSLNASVRESCLKALRDYIGPTKSILTINHEDVEGHYDHVVRF